MWERQAPALAAAGHRVIACDLPGHGAADRPARAGSAYTTAELAASLLGVLEEAGVGRGVLVGFSLGGRHFQQAGQPAPGVTRSRRSHRPPPTWATSRSPEPAPAGAP